MHRLMLWIIPVSLLLAGCWDYRDLETRSFIMALAIDVDQESDEGGYLVTVEIPHPQTVQEAGGGGENGGAQGGSQKILVSERGRTPAEAILALNRKMERLPLWKQKIAVIVSDEVARAGLAPVFDLFFRYVEMNARARLMIVDGSAREALSFQPDFQPLTARLLRGFEDQVAETPRWARPRNMHDMEHRLHKGPVLAPRIGLTGGDLRAGGAAVLSRHRMVGWLDEEEAEGANWLLGQVRRSVLEVPCPGAPHGRFVVLVRSHGPRLTIRVREDTPEFTYQLSADARLIEMSRCPLNPADLGDRQAMEQAAGNFLETRARTAVIRAQDELRTDFLRTGIELKRSDLQFWRSIDDWQERFPTVPITVKATIEIRDIGGIDALRRFD